MVGIFHLDLSEIHDLWKRKRKKASQMACTCNLTFHATTATRSMTPSGMTTLQTLHSMV